MITAVLKGARKATAHNGQQFLLGFVFSDVHQRWPDGTPIHTSFIKEDLGDGKFLTRSDNTYRVESWLEPPKPQSDPGDENDHPKAP